MTPHLLGQVREVFSLSTGEEIESEPVGEEEEEVEEDKRADEVILARDLSHSSVLTVCGG